MDEQQKDDTVKRLNVVPLNEDAHTPELVLHRTLAKVKFLQSVVVIMQWKEEHGAGCAADWSKCSLKDMAFAHAALGVALQGQMIQGYDPTSDHYADGAVEEASTEEDNPLDAG